MTRYHVTRRLPYTPEQVCALVGDVERYPEFVPWITSMQAGPVREAGEGVSTVEARAGVGFSFLRETFTTRVTRDMPRKRVEVSLISGPFRRLEVVWGFRPDGGGCEVDFDIDFQFKAAMLDVLLKANFGFAVDRLIGCFEGRARQLYGPASPAPPRARKAALARS